MPGRFVLSVIVPFLLAMLVSCAGTVEELKARVDAHATAVAEQDTQQAPTVMPDTRERDAVGETIALRVGDLLQQTRQVHDLLRKLQEERLGERAKPQKETFAAVNDFNNGLIDLWRSVAGYGLGTDPYPGRIPVDQKGLFAEPKPVPDYGIPGMTGLGIPRLYERLLRATNTPEPVVESSRASFLDLMAPYSNPAVYPHRDFSDRAYHQYRDGRLLSSAEYSSDLATLDGWLSSLEAVLQRIPEDVGLKDESAQVLWGKQAVTPVAPTAVATATSIAVMATPTFTPRPQAVSVPSGLTPMPTTVARRRNTGPATMQQASYLGASVSTDDGSYGYAHRDLATMDGDPGLLFLRSYNSSDPRDGPLGPGWRHNYMTHLSIPGDGTNDVILVTPQGRNDRHTWRPDGSFAPRPGIPVTLQRLTSGGYTATHQDGTVWQFDSSGKLDQIIDPTGAKTTLSYRGQGPGALLVAVSDPAGRGSLSFEYDQQGKKLVSVSDWMQPSRALRFTYDRLGRLETVVDREGQPARYIYKGNGSQIAKIVDARGHVAVSIDYDEQGRVKAKRDARGVQTGIDNTFDYQVNADGSSVTTHRYPPSGFEPTWRTVYEDTYDSAGRIVRRVVRPSSKDEPLVEESVWNEDFQLVSHTTKGGTTQPPSGASPSVVSQPSLPSAIGRALSRMDPSSAVDAQLTAAAMTASKVTKDEFGRVIGFVGTSSVLELSEAEGIWRIQYDREDRPRRIEAPSASSAGQPLVATLRYDEVGNLVEVGYPDGGLAQYKYDERDSLEEARLPSGLVASFEHDDSGDLKRERWTTPGAAEQVVDFAYDGLRRLRRITSYPGWPDQSRAVVTEYVYDEEGSAAPFSYER